MNSGQGATNGDAVIAVTTFAETHPYRFLLTVPLTFGLGLVIMVVVLKIVVLGPLTSHRNQYESVRAHTRSERGARK